MKHRGLILAVVAAASLFAAGAVQSAPDSQTSAQGGKADAGKAAARKSDTRKPDAKKSDAKKSSTTAAESKKAENKKADPKKTAAKKANSKKTASKKGDFKKGDSKKSAGKPKAAAKTANAPKPVPVPRLRPAEQAPANTNTAALAFPTPIGAAPASFATVREEPAPAAFAPAAPPSADNLALVKRAVELSRRAKTDEALALINNATDPVAAKLIEWVALRGESGDFDFQRYAGFVAANPGWPNVNQFRRKAEAALWQNGVNDVVVRRYFSGSTKPLTAKGKLAFARALLSQGERGMAQQYVRDAWRTDPLTAEMERQVLDTFGPLLTGGDHKARMDRRLYAEDMGAALRAAQRLGAAQVALVKARDAVIDKSSKAKALLDAVPGEIRGDAIYLFTRAQWLRRNDKIEEAAKVVLSAPSAPAAIHDADEWWTERRILARKLLDLGDTQTAFRVARDAAPPAKEGGRVEQLFTAGWIAQRFLNDPASARPLFARMAQVAEHPASLSRAYYWQGRAAEALGQTMEARSFYERAARATTTYYGQIAYARLGVHDLRLPPPPAAHPQGSRLEIVRALDMLYAIDERDLVASAAADMADRAYDPAVLASVAALLEQRQDARALALLGRTAVGRGLPFEYYAYPVAGLPRFKPIGPQIEPHVAYAIARQESGFNPRAVSSANAQGLMQVLPSTAKIVARKNGVPFDAKRLLSDPVYNVQIGAAELGDVIETYRGSFILAFAAYNAGRGRVREWLERFGDPRDPKVDPIDWVERIPFSETRNYVQRVMENMQVYRVRFGGSPRLLIEADLRRGMAAN